MAETVQLLLEEIVPELEDLEKRGIFYKDEIRAIVKKRTNFEYSMKRRISRKVDVLRYVTYELNLDSLRRKRKLQLGITNNNSLSDHAGIRRIHFIFERGLRKFKGDVRLWLQFIDFADKTGSKSALGRLFGRALQFHPLNSGLWIMAASWEFEQNNNIAAARVLLQRAIRLLPQDENTWHQYCRLELMYWAKVIERQKLLGIANEDEDKAQKKPEADGVDVPTLDEERAIEDQDDPIKNKKALQIHSKSSTFANAGVPRAIYHSAIKAVPTSVHFRLGFVSLCKEFEAPHQLIDDIYHSIEVDFSEDASAMAALAERNFPKTARDLLAIQPAIVKDLINDVINNYKTKLELGATSLLLEKLIEFFDVHLSNLATYTHLNATKIRAIFVDQFAAVLQLGNLFPLARSELFWIASIQFKLQSLDNINEIVSLCEQAIADRPDSVQLLLIYCRVAISTDQHVTDLLKRVDHHLPRLRGDTAALQRWRFIATANLMKADLAVVKETLIKYVDASLRDHQSSLEPGELLSQLLLWVLEHSGLSEARKLADTYLHRPSPPLLFLNKCLEIELNLPDLQSTRIRDLFQHLIDHDATQQESWLRWIAFELSQKEFSRSQALVQRAVKSVEDANAFLVAYDAIK